MMIHPGPSRSRRAAPWLVAAGLLVLAATWWGHLDPTDSRIVHELLDHPVMHGLVGYLLVGWGLRSLIADAHRRLVATILLAALGATSFGLAGMVISVGVHPGRDERVVPAPVPTGVAAYEADVTTDGDAMSPRVVVVVQHSDMWSASSRRWEAACLNDDTGSADLESVAWQSATRLVVTLRSGRQVPILVDPEDARPRESVHLGRRCGSTAAS